MLYRDFGSTGLKVSALGMGCMRLPYEGGIADGTTQVDRERAYALIRYAAEHGVNYFDTAYGYHGTESESILGEALAGGLRDKVYIATKQPFGLMKTPDDIRRNLEQTLVKLRTDHIDMYLLHAVSKPSWTAIQQARVFEAFEQFQREGLIRRIGFSYHGGYETFAAVLERYPWDMCQVQQNMLDVDQEVTEEAIKLAGRRNVALVIMEPLRGGGLANAPGSVAEVYAAASAQSGLAKRTPAEWAFRHLLDYPEVSCILSGMTTMEQLQENIAIFSQADAVPGCLTDAERVTLRKAKAAYESIVSIPCTGCGYCMPCPQNVGIPNVFSLYNEGKRFAYFGQPKRSYMFATRGGRDASRCVSCGVCVEKCPQGVDIPAQLQVAHEALKGWAE